MSTNVTFVSGDDPALAAVPWRKATASGGSCDNCVTVGPFGDGVAVRHSKDPGAGAQIYTKAEFAALLDGAKAGEFDYLVS